MATLNLDPNFGDLSSTGTTNVKTTLKDRRDWVETRNKKWNYEKYAYFKLSSTKGSDNNNDINGTIKDDNESIFYISSEHNFGDGSGVLPAIGESYSGGFLTAFHGDTNDIRTLKPTLKSATITVRGGQRLYDAFLREVDVKFKVYTLLDLDRVEKSFFLPGAKAFVDYGWAGYSGDSNLKGKLEIRITNFGFTMSSDGSFDCFIKGLTPGFFIESQAVSDTILLSTDEKNALGQGTANPATLPQALLAKATHTFKPGVGSPVGSLPPLVPGWMIKKSVPWIGIDFYIAMLRTEPPSAVFGLADTTTHFYCRLNTLIGFIQDNTVSEQFEFGTLTQCTMVPGRGPTELYGSADPRKYIFPGKMAYYGDLGTLGAWLFGPAPEAFTAVLADATHGSYIQNILVSMDAVKLFYTQVFGQDTKTNDKSTTSSTLSFLRALSNDIRRLSGGLADIQFIKSEDDPNKFIIFNQTIVEQKLVHKTPETFSVLNENSIVKDFSLDSDLDVDKMLAMTIGRVKAGEVSIAPFKALNGNIPDIKVKPDTTSILDDLINASVAYGETAKYSILWDGMDDSKVTSIADNMRKLLTTESDVAGNDAGTQVSLPFNLKLGLTLDGVENIGFMEPITIDRLPDNYKNHDGMRFLVDGLEHSFDGKGGWTTKISTVMKIGKVK